MKIKITPPGLYQTFIVFMIAALFLPLKRTILFPYNLFGLVLLIIGIYFSINTKKMFKRTQTPIHPFARPLKLHTGGIFKLTRNPMYLGIIVGLAGIAILTGLMYNLIFPALYIFILDIFFVRKEEELLEKEFGKLYTQYKMKTRRWI